MIRWLLRLAVLAGLGYLAWKAWQLMQEDEDHSHEWLTSRPPVATEEPVATTGRGAAEQAVDDKDTWVKPVGSRCPPGYPVKAKTSSKVYRVPGMFSYEESKPERCYRDEDAAIADGFTRAKR